ncbi:hypothetical protein F183_A42620 [Bryobacterales bacterium F-183]|nr:hypothetical protein F183_A42620 [Bryobacterales bacterium F-183]
MGFFSPWFLVGALGIGLPLWLHLLRRHKTEPREFSSLMFFEQRQQSSVKHRRLRYLLLLAMRIALLLLLALLFARPYFITENPQVTGNKLRIVAVDRSFSMRTSGALERAKTQAHSLVASRGAGGQAQVVALNGSVEVLTQPTSDPAGLDAAIDGIVPGDGKTSYGELARFVRTVAANAKVPIELHLIGDLQKTGLPPGFADLQLPNGTDLQVHSVSATETRNFAVENVRAPGVVTDPKKVRFEATIASYQTTEPTKKTVTMMINGQTVQTKEVTIPAFGRGRVEFTGLDASFGLNKGEVRIDSGDVLAADDKFYFGFERVEPRKVLVAHDSRQARSLTYLKAALESAGDTPFTIESMSCETTAGVDPSKYAFVMLGDCGTLPNTFEADLRKYAQAGGSVFVTLGFSSASRNKVPLTDWTIETSRYEGRDGERFLIASQVDAGHPVTRRADALDAVRFYQIVRFTPGPSRTIAKVGDGGALLSEVTFGEGKVMVFGSTLDNLANDFPLHASFVPFVEHMFNYMGGTSEKPGAVPVASSAELRNAKSNAAAEVIGPTGKSELSLAESTRARSFTFAHEGFYEIRRANQKPELFAVNADRRESDLTPVTQDTIEAWKRTGSTTVSSTGDGRLLDEREKLYDPWRILLFVLVLIVAAETFIGSRYLSESRDSEAAS